MAATGTAHALNSDETRLDEMRWDEWYKNYHQTRHTLIDVVIAGVSSRASDCDVRMSKSSVRQLHQPVVATLTARCRHWATHQQLYTTHIIIINSPVTQVMEVGLYCWRADDTYTAWNYERVTRERRESLNKLLYRAATAYTGRADHVHSSVFARWRPCALLSIFTWTILEYACFLNEISIGSVVLRGSPTHRARHTQTSSFRPPLINIYWSLIKILWFDWLYNK